MDVTQLRENQKEAFNIIENSFRRNRLSHAYIFEGDAGSMKFDAALFFAAKLLCKHDEAPCLDCHDCRRVHNITHPNLYVVRLKKTEIVKDDIRGLQSEFSKTALEEGPKVYIIEQAEKMNAYAQNALLKFLEEPLSETYAILLSLDADKMLPTIQSRSQRVPFHRLSESSIESMLLEAGYEQTQSKLAARMQATYEDAKTFLNDVYLDELIDAASAVYDALANDESALVAFHREADGLLGDKEKVAYLIDVFIHYQKDLIYGKIKNQSQMIFAEAVDTIERLNARFPMSHHIDILERMLTIKVRLRSHINVKLALDNLMIALDKGEPNEE